MVDEAQKQKLEYLAIRLFDSLTETQRARLLAVSKPRKGCETPENLFFYNWVVKREKIIKELLNDKD